MTSATSWLLSTDSYISDTEFAASGFCCFHSCSGGWYMFVEFIQLHDALKNISMFIVVKYLFAISFQCFLDD